MTHAKEEKNAMKTGLWMLFPKAHEIEMEITKIIGCNDKLNSWAWGNTISCFGNDGSPLGQAGFQSTPKMAAFTSERRLFPGGKEVGGSGEGSEEGVQGN